MLNELQQLRQSLSSRGIVTTAWHPWIKPLAKYPALLLEIDDQGIPAGVTSLPGERTATLRNIQPDNQKSFPAFNLNCPIFEVPIGGDLGLFTSAHATDILAQTPLVYKKKDFDRLQRLLRDFPTNEIAPLLAGGSGEPLLASTLELLAILKLRQGNSEDFLRQFAATLILAGQQGSIPHQTVLDVLFGRLNRKGTRDPWQCILFLDLKDLSRVSHRIADASVASAWSEAMLAPADAASRTENIFCALTGDVGPAIGDKMPNPNLPLLGGTYLFSMNADIPCQTRYGQSSTRLFPVTQDAVQAVNDALLHMTAPDQRGKTWSSVPSGTAETPDLLIAYLESSPEGQIRLAATMGDDDEAMDEEWEAIGSAPPPPDRMSPFAKRLERLLQAVELQQQQQSGVHDDHLRLFVLSTIDKGRKQVLFDARYSVKRIFAAHRRWIEGTKNAPPIDTLLLRGKGKKSIATSLRAPSLSAVVRSFREQWIRLGERSQKVSGVSLGRIYKLLLDENPSQEAKWLLERFLPLKLVLLTAAGLPGRSEKTKDVYTYTGAALSGVARIDLLTSVAVLGILLHALGREKERYMSDQYFLLGQLLQAADRLHILYCKGVRGGQVPPQLIGNTLLGHAAQSPAKALALLGQRLPVYERYATQLANMPMPSLAPNGANAERQHAARLKQEAWYEATKIKRQMGRISAALVSQSLDSSRDPKAQAELLLGYLAAPPTKANGESKESNTEQTEKVDGTKGEQE
jgi:hypothetical protein